MGLWSLKWSFELHVELLGQRAKALGDLISGNLESGQMKFEAGQEDAGFDIGVLVRLQNVAAVAENEAGDS